MDGPPRPVSSASLPGRREWVHYCERCGERMEESHCKIICKNCGFFRDCSDP